MTTTDDFTASAGVLRAAVAVDLPELAVIRVSGADALTFLQAQLTNDVVQQPRDRLFLSGYCTAKGRLIATFHQWRSGDDVLLRLPSELVAAVVKRLSMFVLRSRVTIRPLEPPAAIKAVLGPGAVQALRAAGLPAPAELWQSFESDGVRVDRMPPSPTVDERFMLTFFDAPASIKLAGLPVAASDTWWRSEIDAAIPTVFAATQEKFVPQMINFEVVGGVSFKKGCYPGQEVVARSQYLGKLRRRMRAAHVATAVPAAGADVFRDGTEQPAGTVVMAAAAPGGGADLLFEAPNEAIEAGGLHLGVEGTRLDIRPLPYALFDPTA